MLHYGVCTSEPFQFAEIQNANTAIENTLYSRRRSFTWPTVLVEDENVTNEVGMQEDIIVIKTEGKLDSDRFLMESPLPDCIISPDQSPGIETSELTQPQVNTIVFINKTTDFCIRFLCCIQIIQYTKYL